MKNTKEAIERLKKVLTRFKVVLKEQKEWRDEHTADESILGDIEITEETIQALQTALEALSLAERVKNIKGFPEKKKFSLNDRIKHGGDYINKIVWQNEIIDDCNLYIAKMLDEERMERFIYTTAHGWFIAKDTAKDLAKAIVKKLGGGK